MCALANVLGREVCKLHELHKHGKMEDAKLLQHKLILPNTAVSELLSYMYSSTCDSIVFMLMIISVCVREFSFLARSIFGSRCRQLSVNLRQFFGSIHNRG